MGCIQIQFGPLRCEGIGMSDGEVMERLWSYLRPFSRMTKEMRSSHRTDVLAHALIYYGLKKKKKMGEHINYSISCTGMCNTFSRICNSVPLV